MPNTKSSDIRYKVLDRCLRRGGYSMANFRDAVNEELEFHGLEPVTSLNTIRGDIRFMETTYPDIIVKETRSGRNKTYAYENPESSIYKLQLNEDELGQLSQCMAILSQFEGIPQMDWLNSFMERFKLSLNIDPNGIRVVGFDENKYLEGRRHFPKLLSAITNRQTIRIEYKSFKTPESRTIIVHPYYLKEYNNRWFLIGKSDGYDNLSTFAFDRIERIEINPDVQYVPNNSIDFNDEYFSEMVGVTRPMSGKRDIVKLWVSPQLTPYIKTKPIHESQKLRKIESGCSTVELNLFINYELEQLLLSFGDGIKVLAPDSLKDKIKERLSSALKNYELVQQD